MQLGRRQVLMFCVALGPAATLCTAADGTDQVSAEAVKAAFVQRFPLFAEWPPGAFPDSTSPIIFGVLGADDFFKELSRQTVGRSIGGRRIEVRRVLAADLPDPPHLLFIGSEVRNKQAVMSEVLAKHVFTMTDGTDANVAGAVVVFRIVDSRVRFDVSLDAAQRAGIKLSSRLLQVAQKVNGGAP